MQSFYILLASLNVRGTCEANLHSMLQKIESCLKEAINMRSTFLESRQWIPVALTVVYMFQILILLVKNSYTDF
ncbi:hypothetical protein Hdeb2414_s0009g00318291 [Helianthus debilis subsp. tardiflorus]